MSSGLEKPLATGTNSSCRAGGGGGDVIEPPLQPKHARAPHKSKPALRRNLEELLPCMIPPQPGFSILPKAMTLRRVNLQCDSLTSPGGSASKIVLWQNGGWIIEEYGTQDRSRPRTRRKEL